MFTSKRLCFIGILYWQERMLLQRLYKVNGMLVKTPAGAKEELRHALKQADNG